MTENPSPTLLLSPQPVGCGWLPDISKDFVPRCPSPPAYVLTCSFTGQRTQACVDHTAAMRAAHPDWIAQVASLRNAPSRPTS